MKAPEKWLPIPGFEGLYEASDMGNIRSLSRPANCIRGTRTIRLRILRQTAFGKKAYRAVALHKNGQNTFAVHRLVLLAFVGAPEPGHEACHYNGIGSDNRLANLRWDTRSGNHSDNVRNGTRPLGEVRWGTKFANADVARIREAALFGARRSDLAAVYQTGSMHIGAIVRRDKWKYIP